jgi:hypothetical protein
MGSNARFRDITALLANVQVLWSVVPCLLVSLIKPPTEQVKWAHQASYEEGKVSSSSLLPSGYRAHQASYRAGKVGS